MYVHSHFSLGPPRFQPSLRYMRGYLDLDDHAWDRQPLHPDSRQDRLVMREPLLQAGHHGLNLLLTESDVIRVDLVHLPRQMFRLTGKGQGRNVAGWEGRAGWAGWRGLCRSQAGTRGILRGGEKWRHGFSGQSRVVDRKHGRESACGRSEAGIIVAWRRPSL